jgi:hypothetical protein
MSERIQRGAVHVRDAAARREANARQRAQRNRERGDKELARRHERAADRQAAAAERAESNRLRDVALEGDRLREPDPAAAHEPGPEHDDAA